MGNEYHVTENAIIQCACGGKVSLSSSVTKHIIGGKKPLFWKDIIGAPVACPRSSKQNPCTVVQSISTAGTETNVGEQGKLYLLRTDGFKTDKGRAVVLVDPGQHTSRISSIPTTENKDVKPEDPIEIEEKEHKKNIEKEKYKVYFLRKYQDIYKPIRPSRAFRNTKEINSTNLNDEFYDFSIHSHTMAYLYVTQDSNTVEYKIFSDGALYDEKSKDIFYQNTKTNVKTNYIPIYKDSKVSISYSNILLYDTSDIKKLEKLSFSPTRMDNKEYFYIKDEDDIDLRKITKEDVKNKTHTPRKDETKRNIVCIIDDILAEIEDLYLEYHSSYKLAYIENHDIIETIKKANHYNYTITNMVDFFYMTKDESLQYKNDVSQLKNNYNQLVFILLTDPTLIENFFAKDKDISKVLDDDKFKISAGYVKKISYIKKNFFTDEVDKEDDDILESTVLSKRQFRTNNSYLKKRYVYLTYEPRGNYKRIYSKFSKLQFNSSNDRFTLIKDDARLVMANLVFAIFFSDDYEDILSKSLNFSKLDSLREKISIKLDTIVPQPNISDSSLEDVQDAVKVNDSIYWNTMGTIKSYRDKFITVYDNLDYEKKINSFNQAGKKLNFNTKYMYYDKNQKYYTKTDEFNTPKELINKIALKLQSAELKSILNIYQNITNTNQLSYVVSSLNIIYMLCTQRTFLDEETNKTSFFNPELKHIYDFLVNMVKKRIALEDKLKEVLFSEYQISNAYLKMFINLCLHEIMQKSSVKDSKAIKLILKFQKTNKEDEPLQKNFKFLYDQEENLKSQKREFYESLKNMEGYTDKINKMLEEIKENRRLREEGISKVLISSTRILDNFSKVIALAKVVDYLFIDEEKKNIKTHIGFINDMMTSSVIIGKLIQDNKKLPAQILSNFFDNSSLKSMSLAHKKLLNYTENKLLKRSSILTLFITTAYDSVNLAKREDYDALALTLINGSLVFAMILFPAIPFVITGTIILIINTYILSEIIDSDLDIYLKKSLLFKNIDYSFWRGISGKEQLKKYYAPYLFETTNKNKDLKAISSDGFNNPQRLIEFIGKNYKGNEKYFDTSLKNELSFFKSALFGYKLELLGRRRGRKLENSYGHKVQLIQDTFVKIPNTIYEDGKTKILFAYENKYILLEKNKKNFIKENNYYVYDLFNQGFTTLKEIEDKDEELSQKLNKTSSSKSLNHKKASIIVLSSLVELKYEFIYNYRELIYLDALGFKQISFTPKDLENLEQFTKTTEEK